MLNKSMLELANRLEQMASSLELENMGELEELLDDVDDFNIGQTVGFVYGWRSAAVLLREELQKVVTLLIDVNDEEYELDFMGRELFKSHIEGVDYTVYLTNDQKYILYIVDHNNCIADYLIFTSEEELITECPCLFGGVGIEAII